MDSIQEMLKQKISIKKIAQAHNVRIAFVRTIQNQIALDAFAQTKREIPKHPHGYSTWIDRITGII